MDESVEVKDKDTKFVGGAIPTDLYWQFKKIQAQRKESAAEALENAIRLYVDMKEEVING